MTQAAEQPIHAVSPDGRTVEIRPEKIAEAAGAGYKLLTPEEFAAGQLEAKEGFAGSAKAFGQSALSGATLGLSDVAGGALLGEEYRTNRKLRELANPAASVAGEATGMLLPALLPGGLEAEAARGAAVAGEAVEGASLLGRAAGAAGAAARYSPAGLAVRGGEAVSGLVGRGLEGLGVTGESLLGRAASSGLKMAAGGAAEGAAFGAGNALSEAALAPGGDYDKLAQKLWAGAIEGAEFGAVGGGALGVGGELGGAVARKLGGTFSAKRALEEFSDAKTLKSAGFQGGDIAKLSRDNPSRIRELADTLREEESIGWADTLKDRASKIETARKEAGETLGEMRRGLDEARGVGEGVNVRGVLDGAAARIEGLKATAATRADDRMISKVNRELERMKKNFAEGEPASFEAAHDLRRKLDDELTNYGRRTYPTSGGARPPDAFEKQLIALRSDLENEFERSAGQVMSKTSPEFNAQYADAKARYGALKEISGVSRKRVGSLAGNRDISLTDTMAGLTGFATMGPGGILAAAVNRALRSTQADHVVGKLAAKLAEFDSHVEGAASRWAAAGRKGASKAREISTTAAVTAERVGSEVEAQRERIDSYYRKLNGARAEANASPGTLVHIPNAPETQAAAERVRKRAAAWLVSQAPVSPAQVEHPMMARIARQLKPNPTEVTSWLRKAKTVEDPKVAVNALEDGRLTRDHVEALEATAPAVLEQIRRAVIEQITDKNADISFQSRIQLGILLGVETDPSLRPEAIAIGQQTYAAMRQEAAQRQQQPPAGPSARGNRPSGTSSRVDVLEEGNGI